MARDGAVVDVDSGELPLGPAGCALPKGLANAPQTIEAAIEMMNALPKPASLACFVRSLARPLEVYATSSEFSAQPAVGERSPRVFLFFGNALILSVAPEGLGRDMLELAYLTSASRSVKAEIPFPLQQDMTTDKIVEQLARGEQGSVCRLCHASEYPAGDAFYPGALESDALRPIPAYDVSLEQLTAERIACDPEQEPERCDMLSALLDHGEVRFRAFPASMRTFF
jgi:hypothetical protein